MTPMLHTELREGLPMATLQFIDDAHARFYDLGASALAGVPLNIASAKALRDRMLPFMDLSDARVGSAFAAGMGGRERAEFRRSGFVSVRRFVAWAMEYAEHVEDVAQFGLGEIEGRSVYDPELLLDVIAFMTCATGGARRQFRQFRSPREGR